MCIGIKFYSHHQRVSILTLSGSRHPTVKSRNMYCRSYEKKWNIRNVYQCTNHTIIFVQAFQKHVKFWQAVDKLIRMWRAITQFYLPVTKNSFTKASVLLRNGVFNPVFKLFCHFERDSLPRLETYEGLISQKFALKGFHVNSKPYCIYVKIF